LPVPIVFPKSLMVNVVCNPFLRLRLYNSWDVIYFSRLKCCFASFTKQIVAAIVSGVASSIAPARLKVSAFSWVHAICFWINYVLDCRCVNL
jgi:hypothetical protein